MRRLGLVAVTTLALFASPSLAAWAEPPVDSSPSSSQGASPSAGPLPGEVDVIPGETGADLLVGDPAASATVTSEDRVAAQEALATVKGLFAPKSRAAAQKQAVTGGDPTLALRDLSLRFRALGRAPAGSDIAAFQRPWDDGQGGATSQCTGNLCLHWATTAAPTGRTADITMTPWAQGTVLPVLSQISNAYQRSGYRKPVADAGYVTNPYSRYYGQPTNWGGSNQTDIYLKDLGGTGVYGYCAYDLDDRGQLVSYPVRGSSAVPAFCVLDNDYATAQYRPSFAGETPVDILRVTAAHEYFHATQFAYDALEDAWFMEATSTWAERQLYPAIPDNRQYLPYSQIRYPGTPMDTYGGARGLLQYADWIYFEYLSRRLPTRTGSMPNVVLQMWQRADSLGRDLYSTQAIAATLGARKLSFATTFGQYAAANRRPARTYLPGTTVPTASARKIYVLRKGRAKSGAVRINHLASATYRFKPKTVRPASRKSKIRVNMANRSLGSVAVVTTVKRNGSATTKVVKLNKKGDGAIRVAFSSSRIAYVELTLVNANRSYTSCSANQSGYSCGGVPTRDRLKAKWSIRT